MTCGVHYMGNACDSQASRYTLAGIGSTPSDSSSSSAPSTRRSTKPERASKWLSKEESG